MSKLHVLLSAALVVGFSFAAQATPRQILIVRHAEKPLVGDEGIHLSDRGIARANLLPDLFVHSPELNQHGMAVAVYAAAPHTVLNSVRPFETISPTANRLGLHVNLNFMSSEEQSLAEDIMTNPAYDNKTVIICWVRDEMPLLAQAFGVTKKITWPSSVFDRIWKMTFDSKGKIKLETIQQRLLAGDRP